MTNKNTNLQKSLKQLTDNQKQYKMIIAIYEEKLDRMKAINRKWVEKYEELKNE